MSYSVFFHSFGYSKWFATEQEAHDYAKASGFECSVFDRTGRQLKVYRVI